MPLLQTYRRVVAIFTGCALSVENSGDSIDRERWNRVQCLEEKSSLWFGTQKWEPGNGNGLP